MEIRLLSSPGNYRAHLQRDLQQYYNDHGMQILGVYGDYYVFETTLKDQGEEEEETLGQHNSAMLLCMRCLAAQVIEN